MISEFISFLEFGPRDVPFVAPMAALLIPAFFALLWFIEDVEKDKREKAEKQVHEEGKFNASSPKH